MPKTKISEFSATPGNNTDIDGINIAEGCAPSGINDAIRELMAQLKDFQAGTAGDSFNGPVGTSTAAAGAFTTLSSTGNTTLGDASGDAVTVNGATTFVNVSPTITPGTANGVAYLNGSKVLTTGGALTFDGTSAQIGDSLSSADGSRFYVYANTPASTSYGIKIGGNANSYTQQAIRFYDTYFGAYAGFLGFTTNSLTFGQGTTEGMRLTSTGLGIGTSSPAAKLDVSGFARTTSGAVFQGASNLATGAGLEIGYNASSQGFVQAFNRTASTYQPVRIIGSQILFDLSNTVSMTLDSSGNLGLGVTPSAWWTGAKAFQMGAGMAMEARVSDATVLSIGANQYIGTSANRIYLTTNVATLYEQNTGQHRWYTAPSGTAGNAISFTQAMTLTAGGDLVVGGTTQYGSARLTLTASGAYMSLNSTTVGYSLVRGFDNGTERWAIGQIGFGGADGMAFYTGTANTERARITSGGDLLVGTTSSTSNVRLRVDGGAIHGNAPTSISTGTYQLADNGSSPNTLRVYNNTDSNNTTNRFLICDAGASVLRAEIRSNGGLANYSANNVNLSDRREKTNFAPAKDYLDTICAIPVQTFNYIDQSEDDPGLTLGVVAQDVQAVAPELVMESNWGTEDNPKMRLSIYQTDLQYALMKALQELKAEFDAYKATHP